LRYLRHRFQCPTKVSYYKNTTYLVLCFVKSLPWLFNRNLWPKSKYLFIVILCVKMSRVNKALFSSDLKKIYSVYVEERKKRMGNDRSVQGGGGVISIILWLLWWVAFSNKKVSKYIYKYICIWTILCFKYVKYTTKSR
jgi:hypothetical protein